MKPFRFPLQSIRALREQKEQIAQQQFADAMRACEEAAFQLQAASEELAEGWTSLCEELSAGVAATKLLRTRAWCNVLEQRQKDRAFALQHAQRVMDAAWRQMMSARRDRQTLDCYRDKCRRAYDLAAQREEQKRLDELGVRGALAPGLLSSSHHRGKDRS
jgi:flagellar export protein FliJ